MREAVHPTELVGPRMEAAPTGRRGRLHKSVEPLTATTTVETPGHHQESGALGMVAIAPSTRSTAAD